MKKLIISIIVLLFGLFFAVSCSESDPEATGMHDNINETGDEDSVEASDAAEDEAQADTDQSETDNITVPDETTDETIDDSNDVPDESQLETIGDFDLSFEGQVNTDLSNYTSIKGGTGDVNFNYKGTDYTFGQLTVIIVQLFPIAILQDSNVAVLWLESAPGLSAETKKVFGYLFPSTIQAGDTTMLAAQAYAFYGDIDINLQGGQFDINCIRALGYDGDLNMESYTGTNAKFTSSGSLLDPSIAASQLPYPVCTD